MQKIMDDKYLKNWGCGAYRFSHNEKKDYGYQELKKYFFIDGSPVMYCKKDFGICEAGNYYLISNGRILTNCEFIVRDESPIRSWTDKEYMKDGN